MKKVVVGLAVTVVVLIIIAAVFSGGSGDGDSPISPVLLFAKDTAVSSVAVLHTDIPEPTQLPTEPIMEPLYRISVAGVEDPAIPDDTFYESVSGTRLVGIEVILENLAGDEMSTNVLYAKLIDKNGFSYGAELGALESGQMELFDLAPGEKARGWIGFSIPEGAELALIKFDPTGWSGEYIQADIP